MSNINLHNYEAFLIDYLDGNLNKDAVAELKAFVLLNPQLEIDLNDLEFPHFINEDIKVDFKNELKKAESFIEDEELINYLENNLPKAERDIFEFKLLNNKELSNKLEAYKKTVLIKEPSLEFAGKSSLNKTEDDLILANSTLLYFENQLSSSEKLNFETELKTNIALEKELRAFQKTILEVNDTILFPNKADLKREAKVIALFSFRTVVSVAAAILLIIGFAFVFNYYNSKPEITKELAKNDFNKSVKNTENQHVKSVKLTNNSISIAPEKEVFIAKNTPKNIKNTFLKKDTILELNESKTNSFANKESLKPIENKELNTESKLAIANNKLVQDTSSAIAVSNLIIPKYSKRNYLITEEFEPAELVASAPVKKGFWQRAVAIAKKANKLGIKSIDGDETQGNNYSLSFNSFSVEKR